MDTAETRQGIAEQEKIAADHNVNLKYIFMVHLAESEPGNPLFSDRCSVIIARPSNYEDDEDPVVFGTLVMKWGLLRAENPIGKLANVIFGSL